MPKRKNNQGIDWDLTRTIAAIQMGMPGAFPGMPNYPDPFEADLPDMEDDMDDENDDDETFTSYDS